MIWKLLALVTCILKTFVYTFSMWRKPGESIVIQPVSQSVSNSVSCLNVCLVWPVMDEIKRATDVFDSASYCMHRKNVTWEREEHSLTWLSCQYVYEYKSNPRSDYCSLDVRTLDEKSFTPLFSNVLQSSDCGCGCVHRGCGNSGSDVGWQFGSGSANSSSIGSFWLSTCGGWSQYQAATKTTIIRRWWSSSSCSWATSSTTYQQPKRLSSVSHQGTGTNLCGRTTTRTTTGFTSLLVLRCWKWCD